MKAVKTTDLDFDHGIVLDIDEIHEAHVLIWTCVWVQYLLDTTGLSLYPLKTPRNQLFSDVFRGYIKRLAAWNLVGSKMKRKQNNILNLRHNCILNHYTHNCAYQGVRNVNFLEYFAYVLNEWSLIKSTKTCKYQNMEKTT